MAPLVSGSDSGYRKALDLLARRPHFRRQLAAKLVARGFDDADVEAACDRLTAEGLLDDRACAIDLASGALRRKGYGPHRMRAELRRRGAGGEVAEEAVKRAVGGREQELAMDAARRWLATRRADRAALARHLERKGYSSGVIVSLLGEAEIRAKLKD